METNVMRCPGWTPRTIKKIPNQWATVMLQVPQDKCQLQTVSLGPLNVWAFCPVNSNLSRFTCHFEKGLRELLLYTLVLVLLYPIS